MTIYHSHFSTYNKMAIRKIYLLVKNSPRQSAQVMAVVQQLQPLLLLHHVIIWFLSSSKSY